MLLTSDVKRGQTFKDEVVAKARRMMSR